MEVHPAGTLFVLRSGGTMGFLIRLLTRSRHNHAGICLGGGGTVEAQAAGAVTKTEQPASDRVVYGDALLARIEARAPGRGKDIAAHASYLLGTPYNYADLLALAYANLRSDPSGPLDAPTWWQRIVMDDSRLICSQLADLAHTQAGVHLFDDHRLPGQVTPGDLYEVMTNPVRRIVIDPR